ncbi:hypothetical protein EVAR_34428_1 [Eumeta japonica]|uniref:Uncharacterized protein n=1 Tax=Eumeta variegata TaxID=151549 RepID=A0A4C1WM35_EUMVA|nr:hypothetical protein EVAR_34428_1 [Eumeta japonica]
MVDHSKALPYTAAPALCHNTSITCSLLDVTRGQRRVRTGTNVPLSIFFSGLPTPRTINSTITSRPETRWANNPQAYQRKQAIREMYPRGPRPARSTASVRTKADSSDKGALSAILSYGFRRVAIDCFSWGRDI